MTLKQEDVVKTGRLISSFRAFSLSHLPAQSYVLTLIFKTSSHWDFSHGNFGQHSLGKASCDSCATQPMVHAECSSVLIWTTGSLMCAQVLMHVIAHKGVWTHARQSVRKLTRRKFVAALGNWNSVSRMLVQRPTNWATSQPLSWCFEPSEPLRIRSGLKTNFSPSLVYSRHTSLNVNHNFSTTKL